MPLLHTTFTHHCAVTSYATLWHANVTILLHTTVTCHCDTTLTEHCDAHKFVTFCVTSLYFYVTMWLLCDSTMSLCSVTLLCDWLSFVTLLCDSGLWLSGTLLWFNSVIDFSSAWALWPYSDTSVTHYLKTKELEIMWLVYSWCQDNAASDKI